MSTKIDLHIHSSFSDGLLSPKEIIDIAKQNNVSIISITDHDSIDAYTKETFDYSLKKEIKLICGVEISTRYFGVGFHVLGYDFDLTNKKLNETLQKLKNARVEYLLKVSKILNSLGYVVNVKKLQTLPTVTKAHISQDIIFNPQNKHQLIKAFEHIPTQGEFIESIMNEGCPAFVEKFSITPMDASKIIKDAGGKVILAHPICYVIEDNIKITQIEELISLMQADGIETNYIYIDKQNKVHNQSEFWNSFAKSHNLISTTGSDFHNYNIHPQIGFINYETNFSQNHNSITKYFNN